VKQILTLIILALLLTWALGDAQVASQESPLSPVFPPRDYYPEDVEECVAHCLADDGTEEWCRAFCAGELSEPPPRPTPVLTPTAIAAAEADPTPTPVPRGTGDRVYVGLWWRNEDISCVLWQVGPGYELECPQ
jgi:hypothetical protein